MEGRGAAVAQGGIDTVESRLVEKSREMPSQFQVDDDHHCRSREAQRHGYQRPPQPLERQPSEARDEKRSAQKQHRYAQGHLDTGGAVQRPCGGRQHPDQQRCEDDEGTNAPDHDRHAVLSRGDECCDRQHQHRSHRAERSRVNQRTERQAQRAERDVPGVVLEPGNLASGHQRYPATIGSRSGGRRRPGRSHR